MSNEIVFVNGESKCGCVMKYTSGDGEYSDVHYITPCAMHSVASEPTKEVMTSIYYTLSVTSVLSPEQIARLHAEIKRLSAGGRTFVGE